LILPQKVKVLIEIWFNNSAAINGQQLLGSQRIVANLHMARFYD
jgi:hypothetical protein